MPLDDRAIAVSATFTAEAIQPGLAFWIAQLGLDHPIRFGPYGQLFQQLLDPAGLFARNRDGFNVALVRFEDWPGAPEDHARKLVDAVRSSAAGAQSPLILVACPPTPRHEIGFESLKRLLRDGLNGLPGVQAISADEILSLYPVSEVHDPHADELGHVPYTPIFFVALATAIARRIHAPSAPPFKVIALDCDDTLWSGICGEDGPRNVIVGPFRRALQEFMAEKRRAGMLLALCSKNNEEDVVETFHAHPAMPLRLEDFAAQRINWEPKAANLAALSAELELGLDTFIMVDDSAKECTEVQAAAPEVLALALPPGDEEIPDFLRHVWAFDRARVTEEDRRRPELYAQRAERARAEHSAASLEEFLSSLELEVRIAPLESRHVARVAQLTQRTNQMNATCRRRSEAEVQALSGKECLTVEVTDRFGSYGLTGVMIFRPRADALLVDTFLLSCRALGRGVEQRMVARLAEIAKERGLARVEIPFVPAQRNRPAALFLESLTTPDPGGVFRLPATFSPPKNTSPFATEVDPAPPSANPVAKVDPVPPPANPVTKMDPPLQPDSPVAKVDPPLPPANPVAKVGQALPPANPANPVAKVGQALSPANPVPPRIDYQKIATNFRTPAAIFERMRADAPAPTHVVSDPPRTPLERDLAQLFAELLRLSSVGVHDNFFELGGHSLLAVQLLSRVRQIYGVDLSLEVVYSGEFNVAELAKAVELKEIEQSGADYQDLLRELEGLSDEEARALLAEEQDAS